VNTRTLQGTGVAALLTFTAIAAPWAQTSTAPTAAAAHERIDLDAVYRIKDEGFQRSQVMDTVSALTDLNGPRLTNSPNIRKAADWAMKRLTGWGISNVRQETWGPFGRGWSNEKFTANVVSPQPFPLIAFSKAWAPGTAARSRPTRSWP
jgi:carboxypeptidase Q